MPSKLYTGIYALITDEISKAEEKMKQSVDTMIDYAEFINCPEFKDAKLAAMNHRLRVRKLEELLDMFEDECSTCGEEEGKEENP